jgi:hypothetical protein
VELSESQRKHGEDKLSELSLELGLTEDQTIQVLANVSEIKKFYNWVNADSFVCSRYANNVK